MSVKAPRRLLTLEEALEQMLDGLEPLPAAQVSLEDCLGRVLAERITGLLTLPPWDNSAMDGYAVRARDLEGGSDERPVALRVIGEAAAGHRAEVSVEPGTAVRILTGAPLPAGADAVVPVEETVQPAEGASGADATGDSDADREIVLIRRPATPGAHIRRAGSDLRPGYPLLDAGRLVTPAALAVAAAAGHGQLAVHARPRLAVLATGDELVPPGAELGPAQIPDSNSIGLAGQAREAGAEVRGLGIAADRVEDVLARLRPALAWADLVVVSGGVSVGLHDVVKEAFERIGRLQLWRVAVQPGKPLAFARAPRPGGDDESRPGEVLLFGLPGNPVSSFVTFELFVRPVIRRLAGHAKLQGRDIIRARLTQPVSKGPGRRAFLRVRLAQDEQNGAWSASLAGGQGSHVLSALAAADGLAIVPEDRETLPEGAEVEVIRLDTLRLKNLGSS